MGADFMLITVGVIAIVGFIFFKIWDKKHSTQNN